MRILLNYLLISILSSSAVMASADEKGKARPQSTSAGVVEVITQHSDGKFIFEAVRQPLGKQIERRMGNYFVPPFVDAVVYRVWEIHPKGNKLIKEITYNEVLNAIRHTHNVSGSNTPRPHLRIEDETEEIPEHATRLDFLDFNARVGIVCFKGYDPLQNKTSAHPIFYTDLKTNVLRYASSSLTTEIKPSISPSGEFLALQQTISENWESIQIIQLGEHPKSLGLLMNDSNHKLIEDGFNVEDKIIGWGNDDQIKVKHRVFSRKQGDNTPPSKKTDEEISLKVGLNQHTAQ